MGHADFRLAGKVFASLGYPDHDHAMVKLTPDQQPVFLKACPEAFSPCAGAWGRQGSTSIVLGAARVDLVRQALAAASGNVARKREPKRGGARHLDVGKVTAVHPHAVFWEPLESDPTFFLRPMFGTKAVYLHGKIVLCFSVRKEPWRGVLVATEQTQHASLVAELPSLSPHPILPKWLYVPESSDRFEPTVELLVQLVRKRDPRIGVVPKAKAKRRGEKIKVTPSATTKRAHKRPAGARRKAGL